MKTPGSVALEAAIFLQTKSLYCDITGFTIHYTRAATNLTRWTGGRGGNVPFGSAANQRISNYYGVE